jgi:hypothetical protein
MGLGQIIYFLDNSSRCVYDIRIGFADGSHEDYAEGRNLLQIRHYSIQRRNERRF